MGVGDKSTLNLTAGTTQGESDQKRKKTNIQNVDKNDNNNNKCTSKNKAKQTSSCYICRETQQKTPDEKQGQEPSGAPNKKTNGEKHKQQLQHQKQVCENITVDIDLLKPQDNTATL